MAPPDDEGFYDELSRLNNDLVNVQRELAKKNAALAELNALKDQFLGMATHDLRKPIGVVIAFAEFLEDEELSEEAKGHLERILRSARGMSRIVDDFLAVAMINVGRLNLECEPTHVRGLVDAVVADARVFAQRKRILLEVAEKREVGRMWVDPAKAEQALRNLVMNAIEHSHPGSGVSVEIDGDGMNVTLTVADHGVGMDAKTLAQLFEPGHRARSPKTGGERSSGLGLVIARKVIEAHGGTIQVASEVGHGSTFRITLPVEGTPLSSANGGSR